MSISESIYVFLEQYISDHNLIVRGDESICQILICKLIDLYITISEFIRTGRQARELENQT